MGLSLLFSSFLNIKKFQQKLPIDRFEVPIHGAQRPICRMEGFNASVKIYWTKTGSFNVVTVPVDEIECTAAQF